MSELLREKEEQIAGLMDEGVYRMSAKQQTNFQQHVAHAAPSVTNLLEEGGEPGNRSLSTLTPLCYSSLGFGC